PIAVLPAEGTEQPFLGDSNGPSQATRELVDAEARRIVDECYARALEVLRDNRDRLERLAEALLRHETLDADAAYEAAGVERTARPDFRPGESDAAHVPPAPRDATPPPPRPPPTPTPDQPAPPPSGLRSGPPSGPGPLVRARRLASPDSGPVGRPGPLVRAR